MGPLLFSFYINDLPTEISSTIRQYADDVIIYRPIITTEDVIHGYINCISVIRPVRYSCVAVLLCSFNKTMPKHVLLFLPKRSKGSGDF